MAIQSAIFKSINSFYEHITKEDNRFVVVSVITVLAFVVRIIRIDFQSLWFDELYSILATKPENDVRSIIEYCKGDQPPFYFLLLHAVFKVFGASAVGGRLMSAVVGAAAIPVIYLLGREASGHRVGIVSCVLLAANFFHIQYSQEMRFYSLLFLLTTTSYVFFFKWLRKPGAIGASLGYLLSTTALLYTHYYGMLIIICQGFSFGLMYFRKSIETKDFVRGSLIAAGTVLLFSPWFSTVVRDLRVTQFWLGKPSPLFFLEYLYGYFGKDIITTGLFVGLGVVAFRKSGSPYNPTANSLLLIAVWLFLSYAIPYVKSITGTPALHIRYTIISLPALLILFAIGLTKIKEQKGAILLVILLLSGFINLVLIRRYYSRVTKQQIREAANFIQQKSGPNSVVLTPYPWHTSYYLNDRPVIDVSEAKVDTLSKFYFLNIHLQRSDNLPEWIKLFEPDFKVGGMVHFYKADVVLFNRRPVNRPVDHP